MAHIFSRAQEKPEEEQPDTSASTDI
jgi:hypothetical protein